MYKEYVKKVQEVIGKMDVEKMSINEMNSLLSLAWQIEAYDRLMAIQPVGLVNDCCCGLTQTKEEYEDGM